jgi:hypothetical protein
LVALCMSLPFQTNVRVWVTPSRVRVTCCN